MNEENIDWKKEFYCRNVVEEEIKAVGKSHGIKIPARIIIHKTQENDEIEEAKKRSNFIGVAYFRIPRVVGVIAYYGIGDQT